MIKSLLELIQQVHFFGIGGIARAIYFALLGELGQFWGRTQRQTGPFEPVGALLDAAAIHAGARLRYTHGDLEIIFLRPGIVRLSWHPGTPPIPYAVVRSDWLTGQVHLSRSQEGWELKSDLLRVVAGTNGRIRFYDRAGALLREEHPPERRGEEWHHRTTARPAERFYGLGEHTGPLSLCDRSLRLWNTDPMWSYGPEQAPLYMNIPVYLSLHTEGSYLAFYENSYPATFAFHDGSQVHFEGGMLRYYVIAGPPDQAFERYTALTGRPALPPRWALGFHQSRFSYRNEAEVRAVAEGFRSRDLPLSAIHLDIHYMHGFRVFTIDRSLFPDMQRLAHDLAAAGVRLVTILDPGVKRELAYPLYREGLARRMFCLTLDGRVAIGPVWPGWCAFPDFTDPQVRTWWGRQYRGLLDAGVAGFWHDMNEPAITGAWGQRTLAHTVQHALEGRSGTHLEAHNLYGLLMARAGYEGLRRLAPARRPFILTRSGWAGIQRYAWSWTGDVQGTWAMLRQTVVMVLGLSLSGVYYTGPDIGGFKGVFSTELFVRWFQVSTFLPFFRTHSALMMPRREPWEFGDEALAILRELLRLRMQLMPYLYTLAWQAHRSGAPLVRPLFWADTSDQALWEVDDAFMLGEALLVAPVLDQAVRERTVRLPSGQWYAWGSDTPVAGGRTISMEAPLEQVPLFVRAGSIVPLAEDGELVVHLYAPDDHQGAGAIYTDAGDGDGPWQVDRFQLTRVGRALALDWVQEGSHPPITETMTLHVHGAAIGRVRLDGPEGVLLAEGGPRFVVQPHERVWLEE